MNDTSSVGEHPNVPRMTAPYHTHEWSMILTLPTTDAHGATKVVGMVKPRSSCRFITGRCFKSGHQIQRHHPKQYKAGAHKHMVTTKPALFTASLYGLIPGGWERGSEKSALVDKLSHLK